MQATTSMEFTLDNRSKIQKTASKDKREINKKKKGGESLSPSQEQYNDAEGMCMPIKLKVCNA